MLWREEIILKLSKGDPWLANIWLIIVSFRRPTF